MHLLSRVLRHGFQLASQSRSASGFAAAFEGTADAARTDLTPAAIVACLNKAVVGQQEAKRAVAIALRNRWRRMKIEPPSARDEVLPKNILMVGPTGSGKTEIARRLARLANAPFIKVEATKYTELGYVGRDVDDIVKDLVEAAISLTRSRMREQLQRSTKERAEAIILSALVGPHATDSTLTVFRDMYRKGQLDDRTVEVDLAQQPGPSGSGLPPSTQAWFSIVDTTMRGDKGPAGGMGGAAAPRRPGGLGLHDGSQGGSGNKRRMKVGEARTLLEEAEVERALQSDAVVKEAVRSAEQDGIVFIDEIDKIVESSSHHAAGRGIASSEGVQRDLLPIIEGSVVQTKYGNVSTDHMLFICSGAFHSAKPSDMLAELQGRLPIRVELRGLTADDFYRILTEPEHNLIRQQQALLETEGVELRFTEGALRACARVAEEANRMLDNIGARRLHTVLERVLAEISFTAPERLEGARAQGKQMLEYTVDEPHVMHGVGELLKKQDLSRYVL